MHMTKCKKQIWKGFKLYDSNYMASGKGKALMTVKRAVVARDWG